MGLLNKIKTVTGQVKSKYNSALSAFVTSKPMQSTAGRVAIKAGGLIAKAGSLGGKALFGTKVRAAITVGTLGVAAYSYLKKKSSAKKAAKAVSASAVSRTLAQPETQKLAQKGGANLSSRVVSYVKAHPAKTAAGIAALGAAAYVAEQVAEKAGVRGGAGFIGKRKSTKRRKSRKTYRRSSRSRGGKRVSFTTRDGRRVSFTPRSRRSSYTFRGRRRRRGYSGVSKTEAKAIRRLIRKYERD